VEFGLPRKHKVPPITWTILAFFILVALAMTPRRYQVEVNLFFITLRLVLTLAIAVVGFRYYWRYWHHRESGFGSRKSLLYRWRKWMLDEED
jgi:uncharacterized membrane protein